MSAADDIVRQVSLTHPLPWTIDRDWTWEVLDARGQVVAKCKTPGDAQAVVDLGKRLHAKREAEAKIVEADLAARIQGTEPPPQDQPEPDLVDMFNTLMRMPVSAAQVSYAQAVREELESLVRGG